MKPAHSLRHFRLLPSISVFSHHSRPSRPLPSFPRPSRHSRKGGNPEVRLLLDKEKEPIVSIPYLPRLWYHVLCSQSVKER